MLAEAFYLFIFWGGVIFLSSFIHPFKALRSPFLKILQLFPLLTNYLYLSGLWTHLDFYFSFTFSGKAIYTTVMYSFGQKW